jgi:hypothetical protein
MSHEKGAGNPARVGIRELKHLLNEFSLSRILKDGMPGGYRVHIHIYKRKWRRKCKRNKIWDGHLNNSKSSVPRQG